VSLVEKVDIGPLTPPRPRTIYLEPISKRTRRKKSTGPDKLPVAADGPDPASDLDSAEPSVFSEEPQDIQNTPRSPVQSDILSEFSGDSGVSTSTGLSVRGAESSQGGATPSAAPTTPGIIVQAVDEKTITATIELQKGGCLPGDTIPIKVSVQHIKRIKSMHGVIVTMYRQGRIDSSPPSSLFSDMLSKEDSRRLEKEEYYPRSRTGLGGLSLSSTTSLSVFRKDLSQAITPLIIDPVTLGTSVTISVKVPENVFPTIKGVPGDMIGFKYQLEVIVDLGGRLASQIQGGQPALMGGVAVAGNNSSTDGNVFTSWGGNVVDTGPLRREKGVISVVFEVIVGTVDSTRQRARAISRPSPSIFPNQAPDETASDENTLAIWRANESGEYSNDPHYYTLSSQGLPPPNRPPPFDGAPEPPAEHAPFYIAPPEIQDETALPEKERIRRAETRLLPSQPGDMSGAGPSSHSPNDNFGEADGESSRMAPPALVPGIDTLGDDGQGSGPFAPDLSDLSAGASGQPADDKLELERQRLLNEASAPPNFPEDCEPSGSAEPPRTVPFDEPTAPVLTDEDEYGGLYTYRAVAGPSSSSHSSGPEPLPKYER
jgi:arrestin-related trafficking adapter 9